MTDPGTVHVTREADLGRLRLDRPRALNALTIEMVETVHAALDAWTEAPVRAIVIEAEGDNFCAGGDVRRLRDHALAGDLAEVERFFRAEYRMNARLAAWPAPVVSVIDGACLGGGWGISMHGTHRVVTDRAVLAMPETAIGFVPDVGATRILSRLPGAIGRYLGLTGARLDAADAAHLGLATHVVSAAARASVALALLESPEGAVGDVLDGLGAPPLPGSAIAANRTEMDAAFSAPDIAGIRARLAASGAEWAPRALAQLDDASPASLEATLALIDAAAGRDLAACLAAEFDAAMRMVRTGEFAEGVRARLVDRGDRPRWPSSR